jgi:5-methylcytosine-specific restriction endonuclease McrA
MSKVVVLNTDMTVFGTTTWENAICMIERERAESVVDSKILIHTRRKIYKPLVIRILNTVRFLWKKAVPWSKPNVHTRDNYTCQYCVIPLSKKEVTIDHVIPRGRGGKNSWANTVCSCFSCNNKKGNKTPSEANMFLKKQPVRPTIMEFILAKVRQEGVESLLKDLDYFN